MRAGNAVAQTFDPLSAPTTESGSPTALAAQPTAKRPLHRNPIVWIAAPVVLVLIILGIVALGSPSTGAQDCFEVVTALRQGDVTTRSSLLPNTWPMGRHQGLSKTPKLM